MFLYTLKKNWAIKNLPFYLSRHTKSRWPLPYRTYQNLLHMVVKYAATSSKTRPQPHSLPCLTFLLKTEQTVKQADGNQQDTHGLDHVSPVRKWLINLAYSKDLADLGSSHSLCLFLVPSSLPSSLFFPLLSLNS